MATVIELWPRQPLDVASLGGEQLVHAVREAIRQRIVYRERLGYRIYRQDREASAREVANVLLGKEFGRRPRVEPSSGDVVQLADRLADLARAGRLLQRVPDRDHYRLPAEVEIGGRDAWGDETRLRREFLESMDRLLASFARSVEYARRALDAELSELSLPSLR